MKHFPLPKKDAQLAELIKITNHKVLANWAIDCFNKGRFLFNKDYEENKIIDKALDILKLWINDGITMREARKYCWIVLKAAREIEQKDKVACQILRACSHTLATCHVPTHSEGAGIYVISAMQYAGKDTKDERTWQINRLLELRS